MTSTRPSETLVTATLSVGSAPSDYRGQINFLPSEAASLIAQIIEAARAADPSLDDRSNEHLPLLSQVAELTGVVLVDWLSRAVLLSRMDGLSAKQADLMVQRCQFETGRLDAAIDRDAQDISLWGVAERAGIVPDLTEEGEVFVVLGSGRLTSLEDDYSPSPGL